MWQGNPDIFLCVTSREGRGALENLRELLDSDLSTVPREQLEDGVRQAELLFDEAQVWGGRLISELRTRQSQKTGLGLSWAEISNATDVPPTTLRNRVAKAEGADPAADG